MRHLLSLILAVVAVVVFFVVFADKCGTKDKVYDCSDTTVKDSIPESGEIQDVESEISQLETNDSECYYGDTIFQYDGMTVVYDNSSFGDDGIASVSRSAFVTYNGAVPIDTCMVDGNGCWFADEETLKFSIGVDTVYYSLKRLPKSVYPEAVLSPPGVREFSYSRSFSLSDSSFDCDFVFRAYLPENPPVWLKQFIAVTMRNDIQALYLDNKGADRILNRYYGIKKHPKKVFGLNAARKTPEEIAGYFSEEHERLYRNEFKCDDSVGLGPKYDYFMHLAPAWESADKKYVTYRFYTYYYAMGLHGFMEEYYITFDKNTGAILGFNDLLAKSDVSQIIDRLDRKLTDRKIRMGYRNDTIFPSGLEEGDLESNTNVIIKERRDSLYYPRPAMTDKGIVFTYQPYEVAAFSEGVVHILLPYSEIKKSLKIRP